jgi:hypothetical protein
MILVRPHFRRLLLPLVALFLSVSPCLPIGAQNVRQHVISTVGSEGISAMEQLSAGVGWAMVQGRLLWTNNNGTTWTDITPRGLTAGMIDNIFSLDVSHVWILSVSSSVSPNEGKSDIVVRLFRTENGGRSWSSVEFNTSSYPILRDTMATPKSLFFVDAERGWFLWRQPTSSAFSAGKLFQTGDGGITWTQLPDPPAASGFRFHTPQDGWMAGGAGGDDLWVSHDGGKTWLSKYVTPPANCGKCRPSYDVPNFQTPNIGALAVTFIDDNVSAGRYVNSGYATYDGGNSWQITDSYEESRPYPKTGLASSLDTHIIRVFSDPQRGVQIRSGSSVINSPYPKELSASGLIAGAKFIDDSNGWFTYRTYKCNKFRSTSADGPGLPCLDGVQRNDLLATTDGGKTFRVITPPAFSAISQGTEGIRGLQPSEQ